MNLQKSLLLGLVSSILHSISAGPVAAGYEVLSFQTLTRQELGIAVKRDWTRTELREAIEQLPIVQQALARRHENHLGYEKILIFVEGFARMRTQLSAYADNVTLEEMGLFGRTKIFLQIPTREQ